MAIVSRIAPGNATSSDEATDEGTDEADEEACEAETGTQAVHRDPASNRGRPTADARQDNSLFAVGHDRRIAGDLE